MRSLGVLGHVLPLLAAVLTGVQGSVADFVSRRGHGLPTALVLLRAIKQLDNEHEGCADEPQHKLDHPPPPADEQPPEEPVPLLASLEAELRLCPAALLFLECLHLYVGAPAFRTSHAITPYCTLK